MRAAADRHDYELAAHYRDLTKAAEFLGGKQAMARPGEGHWDYFALYGAGETFVLHGFVVVDGKVVDRRRWRFSDVEFDEGALLASSIMRLYGNATILPDGVVVSGDFEDMPLVERFLSERKGRRVPVIRPKRGEKASLMATLIQNARIEFEAQVDPAVVLKPLAAALHLPAAPLRIEGFDISHSAGEATAASCVVWENGQMDRSQYRHFNIRSVQGVDDFASMAEVVGRRTIRMMEEGRDAPGLILIDGGPGQVNAVYAALSGLLPEPPPIVGIAKREDWLFRPGIPQPLVLPKDSPALHLLQQIRDEAHRFAVAHHRRRRAQARTLSPLMRIPGVGPVTAKKLLRAFLTTDAVRTATPEQLVKAVGKSAAKKIDRWVRGVDEGDLPPNP
jgi:excinuclease ABC subunit C